ncbi:MAG TPA: GNAT family N-acetyltransferase [Gaiellaceae bacterium]|nr:GNAT family N-acetyltransferase [Gaiellaceae bacterium]
MRPEEWQPLRDVRLRALEDSPAAFATQVDEARQRPDQWWINWAARSADGDGQAMFLAWEGAAPLGIAGVFVEDGRPWLIAMWTDPAARGRGIGRSLVEAAASFARAAGPRELLLQVLEANGSAWALYRSCGFEDDGPGEPHDDRPTRVMRLTL